ncbi:MAG: 4Fe-4S single cluster domain [Thermoleophilaceae bacterium]|jgi:ferredoxin|nr:4Fe-4S single cluster domain [Thermoleophilaceae bacterium]MEA2407356.1 4Fe-4S single cluster domain [Thermoleophilaceae bacterium]
MDVHVDDQLCIGAEYCVRYAPGAFEMDGGVATVRDPADATDEQLHRAANACPAGAIFLDAETSS